MPKCREKMTSFQTFSNELRKHRTTRDSQHIPLTSISPQHSPISSTIISHTPQSHSPSRENAHIAFHMETSFDIAAIYQRIEKDRISFRRAFGFSAFSSIGCALGSSSLFDDRCDLCKPAFVRTNMSAADI